MARALSPSLRMPPPSTSLRRRPFDCCISKGGSTHGGRLSPRHSASHLFSLCGESCGDGSHWGHQGSLGQLSPTPSTCDQACSVDLLHRERQGSHGVMPAALNRFAWRVARDRW
jgi:hypothetical protein